MAPSQEDDEVVGPKGLIKRVELVRIITFALNSLGYAKTGALLEQESGIPLQPKLESLFQEQILDGQWDKSLETLSQIGLGDRNIIEMASLAILALKQSELLDGKGSTDAVNTLTTQKELLYKDKFQESPSLTVSPSQSSLEGTSGEDSRLVARKNLLKELLKLFSGTVIITENRLVHLLEQALESQRDACLFHSSEEVMSLLTDHVRSDQIPYQTMQILTERSNEVILIEFSHNGKCLATAFCGCHIIIWEVKVCGLSEKHRLSGPDGSVSCIPLSATPSCMSWSPDDKQILTCDGEKVSRWDVASGKSVFVYEKKDSSFSWCVWAADGQTIFIGAAEKGIYRYNLGGEELEDWDGKYAIIMMTPELGITPDGKVLVSVCEEDSILLFELETESETILKEEKIINSFVLSPDGKFLLVILFHQQIHLWKIDELPKLEMIAKYEGLKSSAIVVRPCFGGVNEAFIACGDDDSKVYIWKKDSGQLITTLNGHSEAVNCVSWNPAYPNMLASASYDHTVRVWDLGCHGKLK